ncbi:MAG: uroporphyrinogen-III C-methyltransferase [Burkholderiales bacterium]|nr:uroporphyrinogen-III C-methyltransferase [Burkholderiales bacterium]MDE2433164.1 uroporphyrinogen-III C-methyltransferase [Burkholderiales bacterium]
MGWIIVGAAIVSAGSIWTAWNTQQRVKSIEQELFRRQQDNAGQVAEARVLAKQAQDVSRETAARAALLETRLNEVALQRTQVEDLIKSLSQSRDENMVVDIDATLRVAIQQSALTGSVDPLMNALQSADDRIARSKQPRLTPIRRALAKDIDRLRSTRVADLSNLLIRLDEAIRLVDEVPLLNQAPTSSNPILVDGGTPGSSRKAAQANDTASAAISGTSVTQTGHRVVGWAKATLDDIWAQTKGLVRVTRINRPEGMLISPDQTFFLKENLKLRLLNARLALLSRQSATAINDIQIAQAALNRYFDTSSRKSQLLMSMLKEVSSQSPQTVIPRPDDTLAAIAAIAGTSR